MIYDTSFWGRSGRVVRMSCGSCSTEALTLNSVARFVVFMPTHTYESHVFHFPVQSTHAWLDLVVRPLSQTMSVLLQFWCSILLLFLFCLVICIASVLKYGEVTQEGFTALILAGLDGRTECLSLLLKEESDINAETKVRTMACC